MKSRANKVEKTESKHGELIYEPYNIQRKGFDSQPKVNEIMPLVKQRYRRKFKILYGRKSKCK